MSILTKEGSLSAEYQQKQDAQYKRIFDNNIIVRNDFSGKRLTAPEFKEFQKIVNCRRPYCSNDYIPQTFLPNRAELCGKNR